MASSAGPVAVSPAVEIRARGRRIARSAVVVFLAFVLQEGVATQITLGGVHPDVLLLIVLAAGIAGGPEVGAVAGFSAGLAADLGVDTPFGLSALVFAIAGFTCGALVGGRVPARLGAGLDVLVVIAASWCTVVLWAVVAELIGRPGLVGTRLAVSATVVALCNGLLATVALGALHRALGVAGQVRTRGAGGSDAATVAARSTT